MVNQEKKIKVLLAQFPLETHNRGIITVAGMLRVADTAVVILTPEVGDTITATAEVIETRKDKGIVTLKNTCVNQKGEIVIEGEAVCRLYEPPA
ncbi:unnamed protein product [marine sediment metagenome]|uniref:Thioesterase domain-containing protein n=1 Tax=marine sediment metagenome TaxID=412755 RepID=X1TSN4_9ZZZZ